MKEIQFYFLGVVFVLKGKVLMMKVTVRNVMLLGVLHARQETVLYVRGVRLDFIWKGVDVSAHH